MTKTKIITLSVVLTLLTILVVNVFIFQYNFWIRPSEPKFKMPELSSENINITIYLYDEITTPIRRACYDNGYMEQCVSDLWAIAEQESWNNINTIAINTNNTYDAGLFGINSIWNVPLTCITDRYCSANFAISILEERGYPEDRIMAIGKYHSKTPALRDMYIEKIKRYLTD